VPDSFLIIAVGHFTEASQLSLPPDSWISRETINRLGPDTS